MLVWTHLLITGIGFDIAGAVIIAWSLASTTAEKIARDIPIHGMSFGLPQLALGSARQRAEARLGIFLLGTGFLMQATSYFFPHPRSGLHTTAQRLIAVSFIVCTWLIAYVAYKLYIPRATDRTFSRASTVQSIADQKSTEAPE